MDESKVAAGPVVTSVDFGNIRPIPDLNFVWVRVAAYFDDDVTTAHPSIAFELPVPLRPDWTLGQIEAAARDRASVLLEVLRSHGVGPGGK